MDLKFIKLDNVHMKVIASDYGLLQDMRDDFSFRPDGYKFMQSYKSGNWDGFIRLVATNGKVYLGLLAKMIDWAKEHQLTIDVDPELLELNPISHDELDTYIDSHTIMDKDTEIEAYQYQRDIFKDSIRCKRLTALASTGAGKSLAIWLISKYLSEQGKSTLVLVPTVSLTNQMYDDMDNYSRVDEWSAEDNVHLISAGKAKDTDKLIICATWQSVFKLSKDYFDKFDCIICDEVHLAPGKSISGILEKCSAEYKIGLTGTLTGEKIHELTVTGLFGVVKRYTRTKDLMDEGKVANLQIKATQLIYSDAEKKMCSSMKYQEEIDFIIGHESRNKFITNITRAVKSNSLVLFTKIAHGKILYDLIKLTGKKVFYIDGGVSADKREEIRKQLELEDNAVLVASYGVLSTGVSIKKIGYVIFASPYKSKVKVLQSLGRGLRVHKDIPLVTLFDIYDNLQWRKHMNYSLKHFIARWDMYMKEQFIVKEIKHRL